MCVLLITFVLCTRLPMMERTKQGCRNCNEEAVINAPCVHRRTRSRRGRIRESVGMRVMPRTRWHAPASLLWYRVQKCHPKKVHKGTKCEPCAADKAAHVYFRKVMKDERRVLPKDVDQLKKAGASYVNDGKWFTPIQEEGYAASQSDHSSPTAKLTSAYLHPQVRRDGLVRRRG